MAVLQLERLGKGSCCRFPLPCSCFIATKSSLGCELWPVIFHINGLTISYFYDYFDTGFMHFPPAFRSRAWSAPQPQSIPLHFGLGEAGSRHLVLVCLTHFLKNFPCPVDFNAIIVSELDNILCFQDDWPINHLSFEFPCSPFPAGRLFDVLGE